MSNMKSSTHLSISSNPNSSKQRKNTKYIPSGTNTPVGTPSKNKNFRKFRETDIPEAQALEHLLYDQLVDMLELLLKYNSGKTSHDSGILDKHLRGRAVESVDEGLSMITSKLEIMQGSSSSHKTTACSRLFAHLMRDLEHAVFSEDKQRLQAMRSDQQQSKEEANRAQENLTQCIARKDQNIAALQTANAVLETRNQTLTRALELLQKELEKTSQSLTETHQKTVELRMQGWDFKAEVDRRGLKVLASVQSRMGFVPSGIQKQVEQLRILKPPGDPEYDHIRHQSTSRRGKSGKKSASSRGFVSAASSPLSSFFADSPAPASSTSHSSEQDRIADNGPVRTSIPFDKDNFRRFLQQTANGSDKDAHSNYLARMDYLPQRGLAEHRRLSSSSSASGYTDRRSSTSSVGAATTSNGLEPLRASIDSVLSGSPPRTQLSVSLRKPWAFDYLSDHEEESGSQRDAPWAQKGAPSTLSRVTSTAASIAVSASSDLLDDLAVDDTLDREQDGGEEQEGRSEGEEVFSDGEEDYLQNSALMEDISRQQALLSQQINLLKLRDDSAGASALRKAGTVSPQQKTRKASALSFRE